MAFSGGTYTLPAGNPVVTGNTIESSWANTTLNDIATALSTCVLKDGTQTMTANLPMSNFKLTGLAAGSAANDSVRMSQVQNGGTQYLTGTAGTNTITTTGNPTVTALTAGQTFRFIPAGTNTGATTLQIDSTAATNVFWNGVALVGGELRINVPVAVFYDGTQYQLISSAAMVNNFAAPDTLTFYSVNNANKKMAFNVSGVASGTTAQIIVPATATGFIPAVNFNATQSANTFLAGPVSGAAAIPAFRAATGTDGASQVLLAVVSGSGAAFDFAVSSTYDTFVFELVDVQPASNAVDFGIRISQDSGGSYKAGASDYSGMLVGQTDGASGVQSISNTGTLGRMNINSVASGVAAWSGTVKCYRPSGTTLRHSYTIQGTYRTTAGPAMETVSGGTAYAIDTAAVTNVRFIYSSGNIAQGTIYQYGIRKA